jgi:hypothetical protein
VIQLGDGKKTSFWHDRWVKDQVPKELMPAIPFLQGWWNSMIWLHEPGADARAQKVVYTVWNIWKERCRRVFDNNDLDAVVLQGLILHNVVQWQAAWRSNTSARGATT